MLVNAGPFVGLGLFGTSKYEIVSLMEIQKKEPFTTTSSRQKMPLAERYRTVSVGEQVSVSE